MKITKRDVIAFTLGNLWGSILVATIITALT